MKKVISLILALALVLSLAACGGKKEEAVSLDIDALFESYTQYLPDMFYPDEATMLNFLGINVEDCAKYKVAICAEGMRSDEIWLIEAKDEAALEKLQALAEARIQAKDEETVSYNPEQNAVVRNAQVFTEGNYLFLLVSPDVDALKAQVEAALQ
jgi:hypothetical protein